MYRYCLFLVVFVSFNSFAASFDCSLAKSGLEKLICSGPYLNRLDEAVADEYSKSRASLDAAKQKLLLASQREWLSVNFRCVKDDDAYGCLEKSYEKRLVALRNVRAANVVPSKSEIEAVCKHAADLKDEDFLSVKEGDSVDINNDGQVELVKGMVFGGNLVYDYYSKSGDQVYYKINSVDNSLESLDKRIIAYSGKNYFIYSNMAARKLIFVAPDNIGYELCDFGLKNITRLAESKTEVCENIERNNIGYVKQNVASKMKEESIPGALVTPKDVAVLDVDNDGQVDYVQKNLLSMYRGDGCEYTFYSLLNSDLSAKMETPVNELLVSHGKQCGSSAELFQYLGETYIKYNENERGQSLVFKISQRKMEMYCKFSHQSEFSVLNINAFLW